MKNIRPLISVVIPVYNTGKYIRECLDSVINNSYKELQIICINDGSTDNSLNILLEYQLRDQRFVIINQPNGGVSSARNAGLQQAEGDYVSFVDSDDIVSNDYFEKLIGIMAENEADVIDCKKASVIHSGDNKIVSVFDSYGIAKNKTMRSYAAGKIYKRSAIGDCRFRESLSLYEDRAFNLDIVKEAISKSKNLQGVLVYETMYRYTNRSESAMHQLSYEKASRSIDYLKNVVYCEKNTDIATIYGTECIRQCLILWYQLFLLNDTNKQKIHREMRFLVKHIRCGKAYTRKELTPLIVFAHFPWLYRFFRIINDPTLKYYEKTIKNRCKTTN